MYAVVAHYSASNGIVQNCQVDYIGRFSTDPGFTTWEADYQAMVNYRQLLTWLQSTHYLSNGFACRLPVQSFYVVLMMRCMLHP